MLWGIWGYVSWHLALGRLGQVDRGPEYESPIKEVEGVDSGLGGCICKVCSQVSPLLSLGTG